MLLILTLYMPDSGGLRGNSFWPITDASAKLRQFGGKPMFIKTIGSFPDSIFIDLLMDSY